MAACADAAALEAVHADAAALEAVHADAAALEAGPVRKAPSNVFTIWMPRSTAIYFFCSYF